VWSHDSPVSFSDSRRDCARDGSIDWRPSDRATRLPGVRLGRPPCRAARGQHGMIALTSDGPEVVTIYGQAGTTAVKILTGRAPKEIPVERPSLLARVDEVIE